MSIFQDAQSLVKVLQPKAAKWIFIASENDVIDQPVCNGISVEFVAIKATQTFIGSDPKYTIRILVYPVRFIAWQALLNTKVDKVGLREKARREEDNQYKLDYQPLGNKVEGDHVTQI
jgi:hypothetical protein